MITVMIQTLHRELKPSAHEAEALIIRVASGDQEALSELYSLMRQSVYALCLSILKNPQDAQDALQDTFVRVWAAAEGYRPQGTPTAWILTIARNEARMILRRSSRQQDLTDEEWDAIPAEASGITPEDRQLLQEALAILTDTERQIVMLHAVSGLKHRELAQLLELPLATVLSKYHRAMKKLKNFVKGDDEP